MVREASARDPQLAAEALAGLRAYENAPRGGRPAARQEIARVRGATLRDHGGDGPPVVLVPSLINPPRILDLDPDVSLTRAIAGMGRRALLVDWGEVDARSDLSVGGHVEQLLVPLLRSLGQPAALIGYCLGGTMAIAAANLVAVEAVATLAAPWDFSAYPAASQAALKDMWRHSRPTAEALGALPMEVLQSAFWALDRERTVRKFAEFGKIEPKSAAARRFVELEEWANEGEPLPTPAAAELIEAMFGDNCTGAGRWMVGGQAMRGDPGCLALHFTAARDQIVPSATAAPGRVEVIPSGHVGMIVGSARARLHSELATFLTPCP